MQTKEFLYYISERWNILQRRKAGQDKPWSENRVFQTTYFCNVYREDDKVTKYIRQTYAPHWFANGNFVFYTVLGRLLNNPDSLDVIVKYDDETGISQPKTVKKILKNYRKTGAKLFNGAYIVSTAGKHMDKVDYVIDLANKVGRVWNDSPPIVTCNQAYNVLTSVPGLGTFLAGQVIADLKNTKGHLLSKAPDWWTFVAQGPGSTKGLNYLHDRNPNASLTRDKFELEIAHAGNLISTNLDLPRMCSQDVQNNLCEFSKYMRVTHHDGRSKRKYNGGV